MESKWTSITSVNHAESDETISSRLTPAGQEKSKSIRVKMSQRCNEEKRWRKRNKGKALCGHFVKYQVITFHPSTETEFQILNYVQHCIPLTILQRYLLLCPFHFTKVNSYEIIFPFNLLSSEFLPWITHCSSTVCLTSIITSIWSANTQKSFSVRRKSCQCHQILLLSNGM